jgi:signal transduction histidine kinase
MGPGRFEPEPVDEPFRLVPQPDGYADYVAQAQTRGRGQHRYSAAGRAGTAARQRSIRSTITILLVIPLLSLIALWAYAATSTVGGAIAKRNADTINRELGAPMQVMNEQLDTERALTFAWQSARGHMPRAALDAQRAHTDAAIAAFRAGAAASAGLTSPAERPVTAALLGKLNHLIAVRAQVDGGKLAPLAAFQAYNAAVDAIYPFASALANPEESLQLYQQSEAVIEEGEAAGAIGEEAALVGGALAGGGFMSPAEHQVFARTVDNQRLFEQLGAAPLNWQQSPDPYTRLFASPVYANFQALENKIIASRPGRLAVSPAAWQQALNAVIGGLIPAETAARLEITAGDTHAGNIVLLRLVLVGGAGLLAVIISSLLLLRFGNRISRELTGLRGAARELANERLPSVVSRLRVGDDVDVDAEAPPLSLRTKTKEVTETAEAFSAVQRTAVEAAVEQARLRKAVSLVFRSLSRRNQSLLQRQLKMLDEMERGTEDPEALEQLFRLDHLTTRMRRQAEGLIILSGAAPGRGWRQPVPVVEALRGAIGEIEDYARVDLITDSPDFLQGAGVADVTHLLAELVENAVQYSPPASRVQVRSGRVANGYVVEIEDRGLGIPENTMAVLNDRLARPPEFDLADSDQLGLFVVSRLAARHQIKVTLRTSGYGGTLAIVLLPHALVVSEEETVFLAAQSPVDTSRQRVVPGRALDPALTARGHGYPERSPAFARPQPALFSGPGQGGAGLPRRQPMSSMAPQLREGRSAAPKAPSPAAARSPEQARALLSSIRRGWRSGMSQSADDGDDTQAT